MASNMRFKWRYAAFSEIRKLPEVRAELKRHAHAIADDAGDGYEVRSGVTGGRGRARSVVLPTTAEAARDNAENNTLIRALGRNV